MVIDALVCSLSATARPYTSLSSSGSAVSHNLREFRRIGGLRLVIWAASARSPFAKRHRLAEPSGRPKPDAFSA
jgi:hypothetical protein